MLVSVFFSSSVTRKANELLGKSESRSMGSEGLAFMPQLSEFMRPDDFVEEPPI